MAVFTFIRRYAFRRKAGSSCRQRLRVRVTSDINNTRIATLPVSGKPRVAREKPVTMKWNFTGAIQRFVRLLESYGKLHGLSRNGTVLVKEHETLTGS
jgi:hypothetical protein